MSAAFVFVGLVAGAFFGWLLIGERMYKLGQIDGRRRQLFEDRGEIEHAVIEKVRAEQLSASWERRAKALLAAHFGPERQ